MQYLYMSLNMFFHGFMNRIKAGNVLLTIGRFTMSASIRKIVFTAVLFLTAVFRASSPTLGSLIIIKPPPVEPYRNLIFAVGFVETMNDTLAFNPTEQAAGIFQIRPVRLDDYNRRTGSKYKMKDLFDYKISEKIFLYYADLIGPYDFEQIARRWNGSGSQTGFYWNRIKQYL